MDDPKQNRRERPDQGSSGKRNERPETRSSEPQPTAGHPADRSFRLADLELTPLRLDLILTATRDGLSPADIADRFDLNRALVQRGLELLDAAGLTGSEKS